MSEQGFHWEGFFRAFQGEITGVVFLIIISIFVLIVFRLFLKVTHILNDSEKETARKWSAITMIIIVVLSLVGLVCEMSMFASSNRMPRSDVDKSGVYEQMETIKE
jgi:NADH:ubiquinone oxidoreductase subunit 6 (subunit J)